VLMSTFTTAELFRKQNEREHRMAATTTTTGENEQTIVLESEIDSEDFFSPKKGNVVFTSAGDGWGFRINDFAQIFHKKLGMKQEVLQQTLWGEYYLDKKTKKIKTKPKNYDEDVPMFVQFILTNIFNVYDAIVMNRDSERITKIILGLGLQVPVNLFKKQDKRAHVRGVLGRWLPLADSVLQMVCECLPSPQTGQRERILTLVPELEDIKTDIKKKSKDQQVVDSDVRTEMRNLRRKLKKNLLRCDPSDKAEVMVFVSKMLEVDTLPSATISSSRQVDKIRVSSPLTPIDRQAFEEEEARHDGVDETAEEETEADARQHFVGFCRIFSGTIRLGQKLHILGPQYNATKPDKDRHEIVVESLFLIMGRGLEPVSEVPAGNIFGIGGVSKYILKSATIASSPYAPIFSAMYFQAAPIMRFSLEPQNMADMKKLVKGLKLLNQSDPSVEVYVQETGEHVIVTAGEVHAERCLRDLNDKFAKIPIHVSPPLVNFKETIITETGQKTKIITAQTANRQLAIKIKVRPLPENISRFLDENRERIKRFFNTENDELENILSSSSNIVFDDLKIEFEKAGSKWAKVEESFQSIDVNNSSVKSPSSDIESAVVDAEIRSLLDKYDSNFIAGFQLATSAGPLSDEPMYGVCYSIEDVIISSKNSSSSPSPDVADSDRSNTFEYDSDVYGPFGGQIMSAVKEGCRKAFDSNPRRLVEAMYKCDIQATNETVGNVYAVLRKRRAKVVADDVEEGTGLFIISAYLPVAESFGLIDELRDKTSGAASPQLVFSHWQTLEVDPFYVPKTEEELEEFGEMGNAAPNIAKEYIDMVRKRKGLMLDKKIVDFAEKQRNMSRNK